MADLFKILQQQKATGGQSLTANPQNVVTPTMGVRAKDPMSSVPKPTTTIPTGQSTAPSTGNLPPAPGTSAGTPVYQNQPGQQPAQPPQGQQYQFPSGATGNAYGQVTSRPAQQGGLYGQLINQIQSASTQPSKDYTDAQANYDKAVNDLAQFRKATAREFGNIESTPIDLGFQQGREQVLGRQYATQEAALQGAVGQQQTALQQAIARQGQTISGLTGAAGMAPEAMRFETFGGGSLSPQNRAYSLAQQLRQKLITPQQAEAQMTSLYGGAGATFLNQALQGGGGYDYIAGTSEATGRANVLQNLPVLQSANTAAEGIKNTINSYLASNPQLNMSELAAGNLLDQWIQGKQLADPKYQTLFNYLNEYTNTLAPILGVGGDPTNLKTQIAASFINNAATGASIAEVLNNMSQLASQKIQNIQSGAMGGGVVNQPTTGGSIWNF